MSRAVAKRSGRLRATVALAGMFLLGISGLAAAQGKAAPASTAAAIAGYSAADRQ